MTSFSAEWLRLREPYDHAARDRGVTDRLVAAFSHRPSVRIVDLGAGAGSNLAALVPLLPERQHWTLVDHDGALLNLATARAGPLATTHGRTLEIVPLTADLAANPPPFAAEAYDLVTAAALFDLVSEPWMARFVAMLARARLPLYAPITPDGRLAFDPPHEADAAVLAAFDIGLRRPTSFGPPLAGGAVDVLAGLLADEGYSVFRGDSAWRLGKGDAEMLGTLARLVVGSESVGSALPQTSRQAWYDDRRRATGGLVGHIDLFALPPDRL
jgi:SAM-dependent methyltransferase